MEENGICFLLPCELETHKTVKKYTSLLRGKYLIGTIQNIIHNLGT